MILRKFVKRSFSENKRKTIFSGIQPTGAPHLGNYFGAIKNWLHCQEDPNSSSIFSVVDLHSITIRQEPKDLRNNIQLLTASLLSCGIDPEKCILFQQSSVKNHTLLSWILGTLTTIPRLSRLPQFKEKSVQMKDVPLGILVYPVLQAADILIYKASEVPVGEDQLQHIQLAQDLCEKFNIAFGEVFVYPRAVLLDSKGGRIRSLRTPAKKMSKSDPDKKGVININDDDSVIKEKVKKAVTDFNSAVTFDPINRPGVSNLVMIHSLITEQSIESICDESESLTTAQYKMVVADIIIEKLKPIKLKLNYLLENKDYIESVLNKGNAKANEISEITLEEVKNKLGLTI